MLSMDQTSVVGAPFTVAGENFTVTTAQPHSTPNVEHAQRWGLPQPAQSASQRVSVAPRLSHAQSMRMDAAPPPPSPRHLISTLESALTSYQSSLQEQLRLRSQQLDEHSSDLSSLYARSDAVLREYAGEVRAAQARTNRALDDNKKMLRDVEQTIADSRRSLGLAPLAFAASPDPVPVPPPVPHSVPPMPVSLRDMPQGDDVRAHTSPPITSGVPRAPVAPLINNNTLPRLPNEPLDDYDQRVGRAARQHSRIAQAIQPSIDTLAYSVRSLTLNDSHSHATSGAPLPSSTQPAPNQFSDVPDRYADYRSTYEAIVDEQHARARRELERLRREAQQAAPTRVNAAGPMPLASVRFPTQSVSNVRTAHARRQQPLPVYTTGQPVSVLQSAAGLNDHAGNGGFGGRLSNPHLDGLLTQIIRNIRYKVGQALPPLPDGAKQPKIEMPDKYSGTNDHQAFYRWLDGVLNWMRAYNLCGHDADFHRLRYLRQHLTKDAEEWYVREIDHPSIESIPSFEDVICAMHARFIHSNTAAKATEAFVRCTYSHRAGVEKFAEDLKQRAAEMIEHLSQYEMRRRLFYGLTETMTRDLRVYRGISPEYCNWETILEHARQLEEAYQPTDTTVTQRPYTSHQSVSAPRERHQQSIGRDHSRSKSRGRSGERRSDRERHTREHRSRDERERDRRPSKTRFPPRPPTPGPSAPKDGACFACGKVGHFKGDPQCPRNKENGQSASATIRHKPRFHAQRVMSAAEDDPQPDPRDGWGGSQYESEPHSTGSDSEPEGEDEGSEIIRAHAMRIMEQERSVSMHAMRQTTVEEVEDEDITSERQRREEQARAESEPALRLHAMRTAAKPQKPMEFRTMVRRRDSVPNAQPDREPNKQAVLSAMVEVAGGLAYTMFDSGSTTNGLTPEYSHIMRTPKVVLEEQVVLQLGCSGSRSKINFGTRTPVTLGPLKSHDTYFDIVNLDRYDCVFGTPFMNEHGIVLDFKRREVVVGGHRIRAFTYEEDTAFRTNRRRARSTERRDAPS